MWDLDEAELNRGMLNSQIDAAKADRNAKGQFSTPYDFACAIVRETLKMLQTTKSLDVLEPACGSGSFVSAVLRYLPKSKVTGIDIDGDYLSAAQDCFGQRVHFINTDYLSWKSANQFDLIVTNPPYVRHHFLGNEFKSKYLPELKKAVDGFSGLSDLYCYFLIKAMDDLKADGTAVWLIPEEFLSVNYGLAVKNYLLKTYSIPRIHVFSVEDTKFNDALVSSCVLWVKKKKSLEEAITYITFGKDIENPGLVVTKTKADMLKTRKLNLTLPCHEGISLKELFSIKRGIATGSNDFFIIDAARSEELSIPNEFLTAILPSARFVKTDRIEADSAGLPTNVNFKYLLDCRKTEEEVEKNYPSVWSYLQTGIHLKKDSYICKHRKIWYWQDKREAPLFFLTYMGRVNNSGKPFKFILNESEAIANNSFLMLYPTSLLAKLIGEKKISKYDLLDVLNNIPSDDMVAAGRKYGGGLIKVEPRELGNIFIKI